MENLYEYLTKEYNADFSGWDFSYVKGRIVEDKLPWSYRNIVENNLIGKNTLLDMDTGGGEFLCSLSNLPENVYATEGYEPNIAIAEKRLKEKGFILKPINDDKIPFDNEFFDIIINRHGSYDVLELNRVLKKDGLFITQQVGSLNCIDINMALEAKLPDFVDWCLVKNIEMFADAGFKIIEYADYIGKSRFNDIGAVVYYLKCIPWQIEDFSVEKYFKKLEILDKIITKKGYIDFILHRFYIIAKK